MPLKIENLSVFYEKGAIICHERKGVKRTSNGKIDLSNHKNVFDRIIGRFALLQYPDIAFQKMILARLEGGDYTFSYISDR